MTRQQFIDRITVEQEPLRRFLRGLCGGDGFRADDIAQEALLKAYLSFEQFEGRSRFSTWLFKIAWNCWYDHIKSAGKEYGWLSTDEPETSRKAAEVPATPSLAESRHEYEPLYMAIRGLNPSERAVLLLFYMEGMTIKEIETIMGMPAGTVCSHLYRARVHLKKRLKL